MEKKKRIILDVELLNKSSNKSDVDLFPRIIASLKYEVYRREKPGKEKGKISTNSHENLLFGKKFLTSSS